MLVKVSRMHVLQLGPKILIGKGKYECKYCNKAPKFQSVEANTSVVIVSFNEESTLNAIRTCMVTSK
jgi:hypothetical protein